MKLPMDITDYVDRRGQFQDNGLLEKDLPGFAAYGLDLVLGKFELLVWFEAMQFLDDEVDADFLFCHEQCEVQRFNFLYKGLKNISHIQFFTNIYIIEVNSGQSSQ